MFHCKICVLFLRGYKPAFTTNCIYNICVSDVDSTCQTLATKRECLVQATYSHFKTSASQSGAKKNDICPRKAELAGFESVGELTWEKNRIIWPELIWVGVVFLVIFHVIDRICQKIQCNLTKRSEKIRESYPWGGPRAPGWKTAALWKHIFLISHIVFTQLFFWTWKTKLWKHNLVLYAVVFTQSFVYLLLFHFCLLEFLFLSHWNSLCVCYVSWV